MQTIGAVLVLVAALGYLVWRVLARRGNNCCGEKECPAAKQMVDRLFSDQGLLQHAVPQKTAKVGDSGRVHSR